MFELKVGGLAECREIVATGWPTRIVRLLPFGPSEPVITGDWYLQVDVDDISVQESGFILPQQAHLLKILDFTKTLTDQDRLLVHCLAGISRSTAISIGICIQHGMGFREAYEHVKLIRPVLQPNTIFLRLIDDHFQLDGRLVALNRSYRYVSSDRNHFL